MLNLISVARFLLRFVVSLCELGDITYIPDRRRLVYYQHIALLCFPNILALRSVLCIITVRGSVTYRGIHRRRLAEVARRERVKRARGNLLGKCSEGMRSGRMG